MSQATDDHLIAQTRQGDRVAYGELIARYQVQVYHFSRRLLGSSEGAQDITQDVFIKAFLALDTWRPDAAFPAWLLRIARNACLDVLRAQQRYPQVSLELQTGQLIAHSPSAEEHAIHVQRLEQLEEALFKLSVEHREILILRDIEGFSYQEIAELLDINTGTVRSRLSRGRAALMQQVKGGANYD